MRIAVTGGAGFIGSALVRRAVAGGTNYSLGQAVEFWEEFSRLYMRGDWGPTEAWGVRTDGPKAELVLRLIHTGTRPLLLKALVRPYLLPWRKTLSVDVAVNDEAVARWGVLRPDLSAQFSLSHGADTAGATGLPPYYIRDARA